MKEKYTKKQLEIEEKELEVLKKLNNIIGDSFDDFQGRLDNSVKYLDYIVLPIIMASIEEKSYNPFSEIMEKHITFVLNKKMESFGYKVMPLENSADLTFEAEDHILHLDIKTANFKNLSDYKNTIPLGLNQMSYPSKIRQGVRGKTEYISSGHEKIKVFPNLPPKYKNNGKEKLTITNGLQFIYPDYKEVIDNIRKDYKNIRESLSKKVKELLKDLFKNKEELKTALKHKPSNTTKTRQDIMVSNIIRAICIHNGIDELELDEGTKKDIEKFIKSIKNIENKLKNKNIRPLATISISVPNELLTPHYDDNFVSGKSWGSSSRFHYENGTFKGLNNQSRVIFINYDLKYEKELKECFNKIVTYSLEEKEN